MLIRDEQSEAFRLHALRRFEEDVGNSSRDFAPIHHKLLGSDGMRRIIRLGMERAAENDLRTRGGIRLYIDLMFHLGSHFENDPQYPWAAQILKSDEPEGMKTTRLYLQLTRYLDLVEGPDGSTHRAALERIHQVQTENPVPRDAMNSEEAMAFLDELYPEKARCLGAEILHKIILQCGQTCGQYSVVSAQAQRTVLVLAFLLGTRFDLDPQFPALSDALHASHLSPQQRTGRLHDEAQSLLALCRHRV